MRRLFAHALIAIGHFFLNAGARVSIDAYEENFDGERPFGRLPR